jgi:hypothetical protein
VLTSRLPWTRISNTTFGGCEVTRYPASRRMRRWDGKLLCLRKADRVCRQAVSFSSLPKHYLICDGGPA